MVVMLIMPGPIDPAIGAATVEARDWRWTFWINSIFIAVALLLTFPIPETYPPAVLKKQHKREQPKKRQIINIEAGSTEI
ncbi:hypothetical protein F5884DRAFT_769929 [Xylogone sp. PMI_703]|nr:hypothetical protein F5884DRAFT_769929 [Xylogone sp. PMI_703]